MKMPTTAAIAHAMNDAPPTAASTAGTMMNTLDAGVTAESVMRILPRSDRLRESSWRYSSRLVAAAAGSTFMVPPGDAALGPNVSVALMKAQFSRWHKI